MTKPLNPWQPITDKRELALLGKLIEELGEASKIASRCIIQGLDECEPVTNKNNTSALLEELADVTACVGMLFDYVKGSPDKFDRRVYEKQRHLKAWHKLLK